MPYHSEVTWKQGRTVEADASGLQFPLVTTLHQGGRLLLSDGRYQGIGVFHSIDDLPSAVSQARGQLTAQVMPAAVREEREPREVQEGAADTGWEPNAEELAGLLAMQEALAAKAQGQMVVHLRVDERSTLYLNSEGDRLERHEVWSGLAAEHLHAAASQMRFKNTMDPLTPAQQRIKVQAEFERWAQEGGQMQKASFASGAYPCLLSGRAAGYFLHEVVGHLFEADTDTARRLHEHRGHVVAPEWVSIGEAPTTLFDDEGTMTRETWMIREGRIEDLLHSRSTAAQFGCGANGHARSLHGHHAPIPRMQHTVLAAGRESEEEMRGAFREMVYLEQVDSGYSRSGEFVLQVSNAWLLADGEKVRPLGRVIVRGSCMDVLAQILAVGGQQVTQAFSCNKGNQNGLVVTSTTPPLLLQSLWIGMH